MAGGAGEEGQEEAGEPGHGCWQGGRCLQALSSSREEAGDALGLGRNDLPQLNCAARKSASDTAAPLFALLQPSDGRWARPGFS